MIESRALHAALITPAKEMEMCSDYWKTVKYGEEKRAAICGWLVNDGTHA